MGSKLWVVATVGIVAAAAVGIAVVMTNNKGPEVPGEPESNGPTLAYAEGTTAVDEDSLRAAVDEMFASDGMFVTEYRNDAFSADGETFECYVGNSDLNAYDMYIQIFADEDLTDQLLLTGLLRPGTVFREITLDHPLEPGTHRVYVYFTQVEEDLATIHGQVSVTMDFNVAG